MALSQRSALGLRHSEAAAGVQVDAIGLEIDGCQPTGVARTVVTGSIR